MEDIDKVLAYQIKKEIADRYFGFRKIIEQDSRAYFDAILEASVQFEADLGLDLIRLYILLRDPDLIRRFQDITSIDTDLFYDPYICSSPTIRSRLFSSQCNRGLTRKSRFKNLFFDIYQRLQDNVVRYQKTFDELAEEQETITEQIKLFYRKNDLRNILSFIRSLDRTEQQSLLEGAPDSGYEASLDSKMELPPPQAAQTLLPVIPAVPPLKQVKKKLLTLIDEALDNQPGLDVKTFCDRCDQG